MNSVEFPEDDEDELQALAELLDDDEHDAKLTTTVTGGISAASLGLDLSDEEVNGEETLQNGVNLHVANTNCSQPFIQHPEMAEATEDIDPLEAELRAMETRMNKIKAELAKKKHLQSVKGSNDSLSFAKLTDISSTSIEHKAKPLSIERKEKLINRLQSKTSLVHSGDTDSEDDEDNRNPFESKYDSYGKAIMKNLNKVNSFTKGEQNNSTDILSLTLNKSPKTSVNVPSIDGSSRLLGSGNNSDSKRNDITYKCSYSGIYIQSPKISPSKLTELMGGRRYINLSTIPLHMRGGEIEDDWVTIAVLVAKAQPRTSQQGTPYSIWQLNDLRDCTKTVGLFLFGSAHTSLWKMTVGTVFGLLNALIMKDRQSEFSSNLVTLSLSNPQFLLELGVARDLGWCKGRTKAGDPCKHFVNKSVCEFCVYHIRREYQKTSSKRADIQSSFSRGGPKNLGSLQQKVLGKDKVFYGGQLYGSGHSASTSVVPGRQNKASKSRDMARLFSLSVQNKSDKLKQTEAKEVEIKRKSLGLKHLNNREIDAAQKMISSNGSLGTRLLAPTPGALNLLRHKAAPDASLTTAAHSGSASPQFVSITAKEMLRMMKRQSSHPSFDSNNIGQANIKSEESAVNSRESFNSHSGSLIASSPSSKSLPTLARGFKPGDEIDFDMPPDQNSLKFDPLKAKALSILRKKGKILESVSKNCIRNKDIASDPNYQGRIKKRLRESIADDVPGTSGGEISEGATCKKIKSIDNSRLSILGSFNFNEDKIKEIMDKKSSHSNLVRDEEDELIEKYYNKLEYKEKLEEQMASIFEVPITAVVCKICNYQSVTQSQYCRDEGHCIQLIKATKRFFECTNCKKRTVSLDKLPKKSCCQCEGTSWKRAPMGKPKKGPRLESEEFSLRGDEQKFYCGGAQKSYLHLDV